MPRLALTGDAYQARSVIASAQRSLNLFGEPMPQAQGEPARFAYYPTAGSRLLATLPADANGNAAVRGIYQVTTGDVYAVCGAGVYLLDPTSFAGTHLGDISPLRPYPVGMKDNGQQLVIVDGTAGGWTVDLASHAFAQIDDPTGMFVGADTVDYLDGYFLFNKPDTPQFYVSDFLATTFDPLYFANKQAASDLLVTLKVAKREIWLLGSKATEIWFNASAPDASGLVPFPFQSVPNVFVSHGCVAKYSVIEYDGAVYWLSTNETGQGFVLKGQGYQTAVVSTRAIEYAFSSYPRIDDAIGMRYNIAGHVFYVVAFPTADKTWVYDIMTSQWHEWCWLDTNGAEHRHRANCIANINGTIVAGDWQNGQLYALDQTVFTDNGRPIKRERSFPHLINDGDRVFYRQFIADLDAGNAPPGSLTDTLASTMFTAADGTLLEAYNVPGETRWTLASGVSAPIEQHRLVGPSGGGTATYQSPNLATVLGDYTVQFKAIPAAYNAVSNASLYAFGRSTGPGTGYYAQVSGDGSQYWLTGGVAGGSSTGLPMGTLASGYYQVMLYMQGSAIAVSVQRSEDGMWLNTGGLWAADFGYAISFDNDTYPESVPGAVLIGGSW